MTAPAAPRRRNLSGRVSAGRAAIRGRHAKFAVGLADREDGPAGEAPLRECGDRIVQSGPARKQAEDGVEAAGGDFDAENPGQWMTHCHNLYQAPESGMMAI
jgi:FtsP/CotA-like multicopper oxidase with cupredoxin domain